MVNTPLPLWVEIVVSIFALLAGFIALLAASGVLRLNSFFARVHAPALVTTVGLWCIMLAAIFFFATKQKNFPADILLIGLFISVTTPVTTIFLLRAALFRARQRGEAVPSSVNVLKLARPQTVPQEGDEDDPSTPDSASTQKPNQAPKTITAEQESKKEAASSGETANKPL